MGACSNSSEPPSKVLELVGEKQLVWKELMGNDLILLLLHSEDSGSSSTSTLSCDERKSFPDVGDAIRISFTGRILGPDEFHAGELLKDTPSLVTTHNDGDTSSTSFYLNAQNWVVTLGDADLLPAVEMGVRFLPQHHVGIVRCHSKYAHGSQGRSSSSSSTGSSDVVPPNSSMEYCITIHEILRSSADNTLDIDLQRALWKKRIASDFYFNHACYEKALQMYKSTSDILQPIVDISQQGEEGPIVAAIEDTKKLLIDVYNNMALCHMKLNDFLKAKQSCTDALQYDPTNIKALCRAAKCCIMLGLYEEADACLDTARRRYHEQINSSTTTSNDGANNTSIQHMTRLLKQAKIDYKHKEKDMYRKMVAGIGGERGQQQQEFTPAAAADDKSMVSNTNHKSTADDDKTRIRAESSSSITSHVIIIWTSFAIPLVVALVAFVWLKYTSSKD